MKTMTLAVVWLAFAACGVDASVSIDDGVRIEETEVVEAAQAVTADNLNVVPMDVDVAPGNVETRLARVLTNATTAKALLGPVLPSITFSKNWLIAYRPEGKSPHSRVQVTRAQLSATGKTLSLWATVTEPGAGCSAWRPNELSVVRVPSRPTVPTSIRVYFTRATAECGLTVGPTCTPNGMVPVCSTPTPFCLGAYERPDGSFASCTCVALPAYRGSSNPCTNDAACGAGGICAGLSTSPNGLCQPSWMRGTASMPEAGQLSTPLPRDGTWSRLVLVVKGQSTVPMDAWLQVFFDGPAANARMRLSNPSGTVSSTMVGNNTGGLIPVGVPGDESINGEWVLEVQDVGTAGAPLILRGARLSVTSRWD